MDSHAFFRYVLSSLDNSVAAVFLTFLGDNFTTPFYKIVIAPFSGPFFVFVFVPIFILVFLRRKVSTLIKLLRWEDRRVGKDCVITFSSRVSTFDKKKKR